MADIVSESGLSTGAIHRYFTSKDEIVVAVCEQAGDALPSELTPAAVAGLVRAGQAGRAGGAAGADSIAEAFVAVCLGTATSSPSGATSTPRPSRAR